MIHSMTGYGRAVRTLGGREITVELRSVNNRFLDCNVRVPRAFSYVEDALKQCVKEHVNRGKVDMFVTVNAAADENVRISLNRPVLEGYLEALRTIARDYDVREDISAVSLSRFPDVFVVEKQEEDEKQITADFVSVAQEALAAYDAMRATEGEAMVADLRSRAATILSYVQRVEARSPVTVQEYHPPVITASAVARCGADGTIHELTMYEGYRGRRLGEQLIGCAVSRSRKNGAQQLRVQRGRGQHHRQRQRQRQHHQDQRYGGDRLLPRHYVPWRCGAENQKVSD